MAVFAAECLKKLDLIGHYISGNLDFGLHNPSVTMLTVGTMSSETQRR